MGAIPKDVIQEIIRDQNFKNPVEVYSFLKDSFKDVLQELLEGEMDATWGIIEMRLVPRQPTIVVMAIQKRL